MHLQFLGASRNVTGSCYLLEIGQKRVVIDCGYFQEREFQDRNWDAFPVEPGSVDAMLLTHAHLDHCGLIPRLVSQGFGGKIFSTLATAQIAAIVMRDSARIQMEDLKYKIKRHKREGKTSPHPYRTLYEEEDAENAIDLFRGVQFYQKQEIVPGVHATFYEAGHILGAASILLECTEGDKTRTLLFSGDLGRSDMPILRDPVVPPGADVLLVESTYGDREHGEQANIEDQLAEVINRVQKEGGNLIIPSFAVERSQDLMYYFSNLLKDKRIPHMMVFLDSPMAVRVTDVFRQHKDLFDEETQQLLDQGMHPCDFPGLKMSKSTAQSKAINQIRGSVCVIAGSGMCTGGRIKHHLKANIVRPESTILFVGYQAHGTLGRYILSGPEDVRILGTVCKIRARIEQIHGFSGHAGHSELREWIDGLKDKPKQIYVVHGEEKVATGFADELNRDLNIPTRAPEYQERVEIL